MSAVYVELSARGLSEGESGGKAPRCASRASALPARQPIEGEERSITDRVTLSTNFQREKCVLVHFLHG